MATEAAAGGGVTYPNVPFKSTGMHHMALVTRDMDETVKFWSGVLGCKMRVMLKLPDPDPYADNTWGDPFGDLAGSRHYFFDIGNGDSVAFFDIGEQDVVPETMLSGFAHHVAMGVESEEDLEAAMNHLRANGIDTSDIVDHLFCKSVYFNSPEGHYLEYAVHTGPWEGDAPFIQDVDLTPSAKKMVGEKMYKDNLRVYTAGISDTYDGVE